MHQARELVAQRDILRDQFQPFLADGEDDCENQGQLDGHGTDATLDFIEGRPDSGARTE